MMQDDDDAGLNDRIEIKCGMKICRGYGPLMILKYTKNMTGSE